MTPFAIKSLLNDDLLLFYNALRETIEIFDDDSQFGARIGVSRTYAEKLRIELREELERRPDF